MSRAIIPKTFGSLEMMCQQAGMTRLEVGFMGTGAAKIPYADLFVSGGQNTYYSELRMPEKQKDIFVPIVVAVYDTLQNAARLKVFEITAWDLRIVARRGMRIDLPRRKSVSGLDALMLVGKLAEPQLVPYCVAPSAIIAARHMRGEEVA